MVEGPHSRLGDDTCDPPRRVACIGRPRSVAIPLRDAVQTHERAGCHSGIRLDCRFPLYRTPCVCQRCSSRLASESSTPIAAFVRSIHPPVRVALSVSRGRSHAVAPAHPARRADGGAPTSTRTSGRSVVLGVGSSWRSARIRSIWAGQTARPLPPRDMLIRDIIARMRHAAAADRVDRQDASKHVSDRFCHVSRHLRYVALVELLIDHPACMMRIAMRA